MAWQVQEAKQKFSELVQLAIDDGPQVVTRRGQEVVVILSAIEYRRLTEPVIPFKTFLRTGPDLSVIDDLLDDIRSVEPTREVEV